MPATPAISPIFSRTDVSQCPHVIPVTWYSVTIIVSTFLPRIPGGGMRTQSNVYPLWVWLQGCTLAGSGATNGRAKPQKQMMSTNPLRSRRGRRLDAVRFSRSVESGRDLLARRFAQRAARNESAWGARQRIGEFDFPRE